MTSQERQTIEEVHYATALHLETLQRAGLGAADGDSKDVCDGLAISVAKLEHLLVDTPNAGIEFPERSGGKLQ